MLINKSNIQAVFQNLRATYNQAFVDAQTATNWQAVATEQSTTSIQELFNWLGELPNWRKWVGDKFIAGMTAYGYTITLDEYETTIAVKRRDLEADRLGIYATKARANGELAAYYPQERVFDLLNNAFTALCYDGKPYFATDHPAVTKAGAATTYSNKLTATLSASTQAAAIASLGAASSALMLMKNTQGRPIRVRDVRLLVPVALKDVANTLYTADRLEDGKANLYKGQFMPEVCVDLSSSTAWYLCGTAGGLKPIIHVVRKSPTSVEVTDPGDSYVMTKGEFLFGQEADSAAGFTFPQLAVGSTG